MYFQRNMTRKVLCGVALATLLAVFLIFVIVNVEITRYELYYKRIWLTGEMERFEDFKKATLNDSLDSQKVLSGLSKNKHLWLNLDPVVVLKQFPGLLLDGNYILRKFVDPDDPNALGMGSKPETIEEMTDAEAEERFYQLITINHLRCASKGRMGRYRGGGWDICVSAPYKPQQGCIVYSFGINYDFSFDDDISKTYGCSVRSYDPSMFWKDHKRSDKVDFYQIGLGPKYELNKDGWKLMSLSFLFQRNGDTDKIIDYLKIDIEINEWKSLETILEQKALQKVKQFSLEIHTQELLNQQSTKFDFIHFYNILLGLEKQGFRRYFYHANMQGRYISKRTGKERTCCYEIYYININYLKDSN